MYPTHFVMRERVPYFSSSVAMHIPVSHTTHGAFFITHNEFMFFMGNTELVKFDQRWKINALHLTPL